MSRRHADPQAQNQKKNAKPLAPVESGAGSESGARSESGAGSESGNTSRNKKPASGDNRLDSLMQAVAAAVDSDHFHCSGDGDAPSSEPAACEPAASTSPARPVQREYVTPTAIEAAREILSDSSIAKVVVKPTAVEKSTAAEKGSAVAVLRGDLQTLGKALREEFRNSIVELQNTQASAIAAQSEVLRTLTEMIYQTSGSQDVSTESLERAFSGIEERLLHKIDTLATSGSIHSIDPDATSAGTNTSTAPKTGTGIKLKNAASTVNQSWQQIRDEMISKDDFGDQETGSASHGSGEKLPEVTQLTSDRHFHLPEQDPSLEIPKAVDPESLSDQELREALRARETFISTLIARIRRQQDQATGQLSPEQLRTLVKELPEELAVQVRHTLKQMEELARMGELELSLERARIARQVNQLEHSRMLIERNARQLGLLLNPDGSLTNPGVQACRTKSSSRRWLGKLGFGQ
jgi:hypothetical protein